jgi:hypothetical protein
MTFEKSVVFVTGKLTPIGIQDHWVISFTLPQRHQDGPNDQLSILSAAH